MSVFPVKLPLYPILNASEAVQRLIDKDAEDARDVPSKDEAAEQPEQLVSAAPTEEASRLAPVGGVLATTETAEARPGGETMVEAEVSAEGASDDDTTNEIPRLDMRS